MLVTECPIATEVSPVQFRKAYLPMLVTEFPIVTEVSIEQLRNAPYRIFPPVTVTLRRLAGI